MNEQKQVETIRQWVRDWVNKNRAALAQQGGQFEERDGVDEYDAAFYTVYCIMPHCMDAIQTALQQLQAILFATKEAA